MTTQQSIGEYLSQRISWILGQKVTKVLNQAVRRIIDRFPDDSMFQASYQEVRNSRSQIVTLDIKKITYHPLICMRD